MILRSSQPLTGPNNRRCKEDERLINAVLSIGRRGYIIDTRSQSVAKLAATKGKYVAKLSVNLAATNSKYVAKLCVKLAATKSQSGSGCAQLTINLGQAYANW